MSVFFEAFNWICSFIIDCNFYQCSHQRTLRVRRSVAFHKAVGMQMEATGWLFCNFNVKLSFFTVKFERRTENAIETERVIF